MIAIQKTPELILNLAPTGMVPTRQVSAYVPLQPDEIVSDVLACADTGITSVHLHARDEQGAPTYSKEIYARIIGGIREKRPDLVICVSCSGRGGANFIQRAEVLSLDGDLRPDMASLTLSSLNFSSGASLNSPDTIISLAKEMQARGIKPEFEVFDLGMANVLNYLISHNLAEPPLYANVILGNLATAQARFLDIGCLLSALPAEITYCLGGVGQSQFIAAGMAAAAAPGTRVGLEDNLWMDAGKTIPASNLAMVKKVHALASLHERKIMAPNELRQRLGLRSFS